jgi:hypothetical protein
MLVRTEVLLGDSVRAWGVAGFEGELGEVLVFAPPTAQPSIISAKANAAGARIMRRIFLSTQVWSDRYIG